MTRQLLVDSENGEFKITIPDDARVTFGPFSPPTTKEDRYDNTRKLAGTLRIYSAKSTQTKENILGVFTQVTGFRDLNMIDFAKKIAVQKGSTMWESDQSGYVVEERVHNSEVWQPSDSSGLLTTTEDEG